MDGAKVLPGGTLTASEVYIKKEQYCKINELFYTLRNRKGK